MIPTDTSFKLKPVVQDDNIKFPDEDPDKILICLCTLSGEFHIGIQREFCEVCDCAAEFNTENVAKALNYLQQQLNEKHEALEALQREKKDT